VRTKVAAIIAKATLVAAIGYAAYEWVAIFNAWAARKQYLAPLISYYDALIAVAALSASAAVSSITKRNSRRVAGNLLTIFRGLIWGLSAAILLWPLAYFVEGLVLAGLFVCGTAGTLIGFIIVLYHERPVTRTTMNTAANEELLIQPVDAVIE
jgi:hypothetical protein